MVQGFHPPRFPEGRTIMEQISESGVYRERMTVVEQKKEWTTFKMDCSDGSGTMASRRIFDGVEVIFNNFQAFCCPMPGPVRPRIDAIEINYCFQGEFRCSLKDGWYVTMKEGFVSANVWNTPRGEAGFPSGHYSGLEIIVGLDAFQRAEEHLLQTFGIDLEGFSERLKNNHGGVVLDVPAGIREVFLELCGSYASMRKEELRLRVLEILLFMTVSPIQEYRVKETYIEKSRQKKLAGVMEYLAANPGRAVTIPELADRFGMSETVLKKGFKALYGKPLYTWRKELRVSRAMGLLRETKRSVSEIAMEMGYENASKFAGVFKAAVGMTPSEFRRKMRG